MGTEILIRLVNGQLDKGQLMEYGSREIDINVWNGEELGYYIAIDTETEYIKDVEIPEIITCQVYSGRHAYYVPIDRIKEFIDLHDKSIFVFANAPFDLDVLNKCCNWDYFPKVDEGGVFDPSAKVIVII